MLRREWFSTRELASMALPGLPGTRRGMQLFAEAAGWLVAERQNDQWRVRKGHGGGVEFHYSALPEAARLKLVMDHQAASAESDRATAKAQLTREEMHAWYERQPDCKKRIAVERAAALTVVRDLTNSGIKKTEAMRQVAHNRGIALATLYLWEAWTHGVARCDWPAYLASRHTGRSKTVECTAEAWEFLKSDYLRLERPNFSDCLRRLQDAATAHGWSIPSARTLERRLADLPEGLRVLSREGVEALKRSYPAQRRDRGVFHALEAVNADGHKWDVFVRWPDGYVGRPLMVAFQDLYSGMMLSWRIDRSENKEAVRLAFGDLVETYGIPDYCWLDNGRSFASKWLTGGIANRYRFKVKDDEPVGIMTQLGVEVHWTTPYAGQSKPIERAFRDFAGGAAKHPKFAGAYTGNSPMAKPENYASKAVPLDVFVQTVGEAVIEHNARIGRKARVCAGRSFVDTFVESYARSPIRMATAEQRRLWLMAAEAIGVSRQDGSVAIEGNTFWAEFLLGYRGQKITVRFDPENLQDRVYVYRLDGAYLGAAPCTAAAGFADVEAAREYNRKRNAFKRAYRDLQKAELSMSIAEVAALTPTPAEPPAMPETRVVRMLRGNTALRPIIETDEDEQPRSERLFLDAIRQQRAAGTGALLHVVEDDD